MLSIAVNLVITVALRWKEEQEMEAARHAERVQQLEQEKLDNAIAQRKKLEAFEISKNNEIEKLQAVHR